MGGRVTGGPFDLGVAGLLDLRNEVHSGRKVLAVKEQLALLDMALRVHRLRLQLEKERGRLAKGEGFL